MEVIFYLLLMWAFNSVEYLIIPLYLICTYFLSRRISVWLGIEGKIHVLMILLIVNLPFLIVPVISYGRHSYLCATSAAVNVSYRIELESRYFGGRWKNRVKYDFLGTEKDAVLIGGEKYKKSRVVEKSYFGVVRKYYSLKGYLDDEIIADGTVYVVSPYLFPLGRYFYKWLPTLGCSIVGKYSSVSARDMVLNEVFFNKMDDM